MNDISGKTILITGAGDGIGRALAIGLARRKAILILNDIDSNSLMKTRDLITMKGGRCFLYIADISKKKEINQFRDYLKDKIDHLDILINNAGVAIGRLNATEIPMPLWEWIFGVNFWGTIYCINVFLPLMRSNFNCKIVNIESVYSYLGIFKRAAYCASKSALKNYSEALRYELKPKGIQVISVYPGMVQTAITKNSRGWKDSKIKKAAIVVQSRHASSSSEKAAEIIINGLLNNKNRIFIGWDSKLIYNLTRFFPFYGAQLVNKLVLSFEKSFKKHATGIV